jgi:hypothetical protein
VFAQVCPQVVNDRVWCRAVVQAAQSALQEEQDRCSRRLQVRSDADRDLHSEARVRSRVELEFRPLQSGLLHSILYAPSCLHWL